jgi:hypothetical protein
MSDLDQGQGVLEEKGAEATLPLLSFGMKEVIKQSTRLDL